MFIGVNITLLVCIIDLLSRLSHGVTATIKLTATAPVNPVKEGTFFALHCRVWELDDDHIVVISREVDGRSMFLFWESSPTEADQRVFLATRTLSDGSLVYFLSVTDVTEHDRGIYSCKIMRTSGVVSEIVKESVLIDIMHFPDDGSPTCVSASTDSLTVAKGDTITLNCSSTQGVPSISMQWHRSGQSNELIGQHVEHNNMVYSLLTITATEADDGAMYLCQIKSHAFPEQEKTCHIGPLTVLSSGSGNEDGGGRHTNTKTPTKGKGQVTEDKSVNDVITKTHSYDNTCEDTCSLMRSSAANWIIATITASSLALLFIVIGVALLFRYHHWNTIDSRVREFPQDACVPRNQIYSELDRKRGDYRVYMALERREKFENQPGFPVNGPSAGLIVQGPEKEK